MSEETKEEVVEETTPEKKDGEQEVVEETPSSENQENLNQIADAVKNDGTPVEEPKKEDPKPSVEDKKPEEKKEVEEVKTDYYKKVGDQVFKTEADYDTWALKNAGDVRRLNGDLNIANKKVADAKPSNETKQDVNLIRTQIKVADFFEKNPDAVEHKDVIAALLRSGKAKTLEAAKSMAFKASGIEEKKPENTEDSKKLIKSGSGDGGVGDGSYTKDSQVKDTSDFADNALTGKI